MKPLIYLLIATSTCCTIAAQLLLKRVVSSEQTQTLLAAGLTGFLVSIASNPLAWLAIAIQAGGYVVWLAVISKEKVAVALALSGSLFYILMSALGFIFFNERLSMTQCFGIALISTGVLLVAFRG